MSFRKPIYPLTNHCSVVYNNTLYVYSNLGFQSLSLAKGGEWENQPMDISLTGATCVLAPGAGDAGADMMYVVGGKTNETVRHWDYPGLMHYTFKDKKWDWQRSLTWNTKERINHASIYLPDSKSILVFAGSADPASSGLSAEAFLFDTRSPFDVKSVSSEGRQPPPPLIKPMLMPWDSGHAVMVGGSADNKDVFTYGATEGWTKLDVQLPAPITNQNAVQCSVISGTDGSKVLETFDMGASPNKVSRQALLVAGGKTAPPGTMIGDKTKRFTLQDLPAYNGSLAPTATRAGFSMAQTDKNRLIVTGGSSEDPLCIFDSGQNAWINATELFAGKQLQSVLLPTSSVSSSAAPSSSTASSSASSSPSAAAIPAPASSNNNKDRMLTVLGATLGAIFGIAALLILLLFCLKYKKSKRRTQQMGGGYVEKDRLSFADRGAEFMSEAGGSAGHKTFGEVNASQTSLAIIGGGRGNGHKRGMLSDSSTAGLVKKSSPLGYSEPMELSKFDLKPEAAEVVRQNSGRIPPQPRAVANLNRSRSSGWSRYFANNDATNLATMPADRSTFASERTSTGSQSMYTDSRMYSQPSQAVPPLDIPKFDNQRLSKVATGSPTLGNSTDNLPGQPMQAELARANSGASTRSGISHDGDHHYLREPVESWTPVGHDERPSSSNYTGSVVIDNYRDGASSYYPDGASSFYPKSGISSFYPGQPGLRAPEIRDSTNTLFPSGNLASNNNQQQHANRAAQESNTFSSYYPAPPRLGAAPEGRESTVTVFPGGPSGKGDQPDMSWLNLGVGK